MKFKNLLLAALFLAVAGSLSAQKIKVVEGDLSFIKGQTEILLEYDYSEMAVGKFDKEEDYVNKKVAEYNEKEAGKGDKWAEAWEADREGRFHPKFEELINKYAAKASCNFDQTNINAKYTLIIKTVFTEPGWNIGISSRAAEINVEAIFVETENKDNVVAKMTLTRCPDATAMGMDFDTGLRLSEAYAKCGKSLGAYLVKKAFK